MKKLGLSTRVFIGFGLGILLGVIFGEKILVIKIIGDIFLKLIKMLTVPLVFFSIISGITNLTDVNKLKRVGAKILGMYVVTTLLAGFIGLGIAHLINPGVGFQIDSSAIGSYEATAMNSVSDTLLAMVPDNIINAMANTNMMGIIIFCAIFGCAKHTIQVHFVCHHSCTPSSDTSSFSAKSLAHASIIPSRSVSLEMWFSLCCSTLISAVVNRLIASRSAISRI